MNPLASRLWSKTQLCLAVIFSCLSFASAQGTSPAGLADVRVTSSLRHESTVSAGDTRTEFFTIENRSDTPVTVSLGQADLMFDELGAIHYEFANTSGNSNASWIRVATQVQVPASSQVDVPFTVEVPDDVGLHGSFWSVIQVQAEKPNAVTGESQADRVTTNVKVNIQYNVTVLTHVGTPAARTVQFQHPKLHYDAETGHARLRVVLHNPGAYVVPARLWLELFDERGDRVTRVEAGEQRLYPGAHSPVDFDLGVLSAQTYQASVVADAGQSDVFGVRYTLDTATP